MHDLVSSFVLGYHGCDRETGERLLRNEPFRPSENTYDWLGSGIYFWETNPDRALEWAKDLQACQLPTDRPCKEPFVVGAIVDLGFCLDLISTNGSLAVERAYADLLAIATASGIELPRNTGGEDLLNRKLDCMVINFPHQARITSGKTPFQTVRGVFTEGEFLYPTSGFRRKTHIQICVRDPETIKGVFRVPERHFSSYSVGR